MNGKTKLGLASGGAVAIVLAGAIGLSNGVWSPKPEGPPTPEISASVPAPEPSLESPLPAPVEPPESLPAPESPAVPEAPVRSFTEAPMAPTQNPIVPVPSPNPVLPVPLPEPQPPLNLPDIGAETEVHITIPKVPDVVNTLPEPIPQIIPEVTKPLTEIPLPVPVPPVIKDAPNGILDQGIRTDPLHVDGSEVLGNTAAGLGVTGSLDGEAKVTGK